MRKLFVHLLLANALLWAPPGRAAPPASVEASYELYRSNILFVRVREIFHYGDGKYRIESTASPAGIATWLTKDRITRLSRGTVTGDGLKPEFFEEKRISPDKERVRTAQFDWTQGKITSSYDGKSETAPLQGGTQDWLSLFYHFLFSGQSLFSAPDKDAVPIILADGKRVETYHYRFVDETTLTTAAGTFAALHYVDTDAKGERSTAIWLARDKSFFLVKLVHEEDGAVLEQRLVALSFH